MFTAFAKIQALTDIQYQLTKMRHDSVLVRRCLSNVASSRLQELQPDLEQLRAFAPGLGLSDLEKIMVRSLFLWVV